VDAPVALDAPRDRNRDTTTRDTTGTSPDLAADPDLAPSTDLGADPDTNPVSACDQCLAIEMKYADALAQARTCNPLLKGECQHKVNSSLSCPCNNTWVDSTMQVDAVAKMYQDAGCAKCRRICPLLCRAPSTGVCNPAKLMVPIAPGPGSGSAPLPPVGTGTCADMNDPVP
jgi:hypothetical protein